MKIGAIGTNISKARVEDEMYICKKGFVIFDMTFYRYEGYEFVKGIVIDTKKGTLSGETYWYKTITIDKDIFFEHFMTMAEWREKQINSILE